MLENSKETEQLEYSPSTAEGMCLIPGRGNKIPQAAQHCQNFRKSENVGGSILEARGEARGGDGD